MIVLALNCGSSSVKFQVLDVSAGDEARRLARGLVERIGDAAVTSLELEGGPGRREPAAIADHDTAVHWVIDRTREAGIAVEAAGHRVVHGGARYTRPVPVDAEVGTALEALAELAPLHNGPSVAGIRACGRALGAGVPLVAVFDTSFHATLPEHAARYALPGDVTRRHGLRRFGFHGISYQYVLARYARLAGVAEADATLVAFHLGNGASAAAIARGRSVDTSMGFTPLEGLMMGTRAGDLDPALVGHLARHEAVPVEEVERWLNERSGLLGVGGSRDMRDLVARRDTDARAGLAVAMFCYRARKYLGAYLAALGGAQAVVFTGGIGENSPEVRAGICAGMQWCGLALDPRLNEQARGREARIAAPDAAIQAWVIPTDEELVVARETARCLAESPGPTPRWEDRPSAPSSPPERSS